MPYIVRYESPEPSMSRYATDPRDFYEPWLLDRDGAHRFAAKEHAECYVGRLLAKWRDVRTRYTIERV